MCVFTDHRNYLTQAPVATEVIAQLETNKSKKIKSSCSIYPENSKHQKPLPHQAFWSHTWHTWQLMAIRFAHIKTPHSPRLKVKKTNVEDEEKKKTIKRTTDCEETDWDWHTHIWQQWPDCPRTLRNGQIRHSNDNTQWQEDKMTKQSGCLVLFLKLNNWV